MASPRDVRRAVAEGIQDGLRDLGDIVLDKGNEVISRDAIDQGDLLASGEIREEPRVVTVSWTAEHSVYVHYGTAPHFPPLQPILEWVERNLSVVDSGSGLESVLKAEIGERARPAASGEVLRVARAVQAKIAREGTDPVPYALLGLEEALPRAEGVVGRAVDSALKRLL